MCYKIGLQIKLVLILLFVVAVTSACQTHGTEKRSTKCILPSYPNHGRYEVAGELAAKPGDELEYVYLNVSCSHGHGVIGNNVVLCILGEWSTTVPQCVPACYLQEHPSVKYSCKRPGVEEFSACSEYEPLKTIIKPECRPGYYSTADMPPMRCVDGAWTYEAKCTPAPCYLQEHSSVTYSCKRPGVEEFSACSEYEPLKTIIKPECRPGYYSTAAMPPMRCVDGAWTYEAKCTPGAGAACEWNGVKGKCVKETQCLTTLDKKGDPHLECSKQGDVKIVCCTDCELVNNTRNVVLDPKVGYYWKDGTKARDSCLQYLDELPYSCREGGFYSGISMDYDKEKKCHRIGLWGVGGAPPPGTKPGAKYPHQALLGYGEDLATAKWQSGGSIISNKYILTSAHVNGTPSSRAVKFVALGVEKRSDSPTAWQTHNVKRFITHPDYKAPAFYNDIALIETETPITFNKNVLPACLHVEATNTLTAVTTTWRDLKYSSLGVYADTIQTIELDKFSEEECKDVFNDISNRKLENGIDSNTQMCYGSKTENPDACKGSSGEPLLVDTQFSRCIYTVIGVTSFGILKYCETFPGYPDVYTRVAAFKPWIESVVWA